MREGNEYKKIIIKKKINMKQNIIKTVVYLVTALPLGGIGGVLFSSCSNFLDEQVP